MTGTRRTFNQWLSMAAVFISANGQVMGRFFLNLKMERVWQRDYAHHGEA